jgi:hypothetical protein
MSKNTEYILESLADSEGLNGALASLIAVAERKANPTSPIRAPLAVEKRQLRPESPYKSAPASPK